MAIEELRKADTLFDSQTLVALYRRTVHRNSPGLHECFEFQKTPAFNLLLLARNLLVDGEATYLSCVVELTERWQKYIRERGSGTIVDCPLQFTEAEKLTIKQDTESALHGMQAMTGIQDALGNLFPRQGIVKPEDFDEIKDMLRQVKEQVIEEYATNDTERDVWNNSWPFDD